MKQNKLSSQKMPNNITKKGLTEALALLPLPSRLREVGRSEQLSFLLRSRWVFQSASRWPVTWAGKKGGEFKDRLKCVDMFW